MLLLLGYGLSLFSVIPGSLNAKPTYFEFNPPDGGQVFWVQINNQNVVTGYDKRKTGFHSFIGTAGGSLISIDVPGFKSTQAGAINNKGDVTGYAVSRQGIIRGFVRTSDGTITKFDVKGADSTFPRSINDEGVVTGLYGFGDQRGFIRAAGGSITRFDVADAEHTIPVSINSAGNVAGYAMFFAGYSGFLRESNGDVIVFAVEGAQHTFATSIDEDNNIAGYFERNGDGVDHPFIRAADGTITTFDVPDHPLSDVFGIVARKHGSEIAGSARDQALNYQGLIRQANGTVTLFRAPNAGDGGFQGTRAFDINSKGSTSGIYIDKNGRQHGFVRIP